MSKAELGRGIWGKGMGGPNWGRGERAMARRVGGVARLSRPAGAQRVGGVAFPVVPLRFTTGSYLACRRHEAEVNKP